MVDEGLEPGELRPEFFPQPLRLQPSVRVVGDRERVWHQGATDIQQQSTKPRHGDSIEAPAGIASRRGVKLGLIGY